MPQHAEVHRDDDRDKRPQQHQELALCDQISLAGLINQFRDFAHGAMYGQVLQPHEDRHAEAEAEDAKQQPDHQQPMPVDAEERNRRKVRQLQGRLAARFGGLSGRLRQRVAGSQQSCKGCRNPSKPASHGRKIAVPSAHQNPPKNPIQGSRRLFLPRHNNPSEDFHPPLYGRHRSFQHAPNTLPPPGIISNEDCRFGRVGKPVPSVDSLNLRLHTRHKALVYSTLPEVGSMTSVTGRGACVLGTRQRTPRGPCARADTH